MLMTLIQITEVTACIPCAPNQQHMRRPSSVLQGQKGQTQRLPDVLRLQAHAFYVWS